MMWMESKIWQIRQQARASEKIEKRKHKIRLWLLAMTVMVFFVCIWSVAAEKSAHVVPGYPRVNIEEYLQREVLSQEDYAVLFQQTGLAPVAVDALRENGRQQDILLAQENLFREVEIDCSANTIVSREERCEESNIPYVEEGDILITFNSHVLGWRNGHAAIVVDVGNRLTLEARVLGTDSAIMSMEHWEQYPSYAVLRLKGATREERKQIAEYAKANLVGIPYSLTAGWKWNIENVGKATAKGINEEEEITMGTGKSEYMDGKDNAITGTHCAHLVWQAYQQAGYNLDCDGGWIVTPNDIFNSPQLEVVQVYGMDILKMQQEENLDCLEMQ